MYSFLHFWVQMPDVSTFNKPAPPSLPPLALLPDPLLQCGWAGQAAMGESLNPSERVGREAGSWRRGGDASWEGIKGSCSNSSARSPQPGFLKWVYFKALDTCEQYILDYLLFALDPGNAFQHPWWRRHMTPVYLNDCRLLTSGIICYLKKKEIFLTSPGMKWASPPAQKPAPNPSKQGSFKSLFSLKVNFFYLPSEACNFSSVKWFRYWEGWN